MSTDSQSSSMFVGAYALSEVHSFFVSPDKKNVITTMNVLTGMHDEAILAFLKVQASSYPLPETVSTLEPVVALAAIKDRIRSVVQYAINEEASSQRTASIQAEALRHQNLVNELKKSQQPHPEGTVAELAARFNVSKSEIRRRKAEGTLNELLASK